MKGQSRLSRRKMIGGLGIVSLGYLSLVEGSRPHTLNAGNRQEEGVDLSLSTDELELAMDKKQSTTAELILQGVEPDSQGLVEARVTNTGGTPGDLSFRVLDVSGGQSQDETQNPLADPGVVNLEMGFDRDGEPKKTTANQVPFLRPTMSDFVTNVKGQTLSKLHRLGPRDTDANQTSFYVRYSAGEVTGNHENASLNVTFELGIDTATKLDPVATGLTVPWGMDFHPDGSLYFTERSGRVNKLTTDGVTTLLGLEDSTVFDRKKETGLLGLEFHPDFPDPPFLYLCQTYNSKPRGLSNRVLRLRVNGDDLELDRAIVDGIPAAKYHDGGRLLFGPDGYLYVTCGDATERKKAQDLSTFHGTVLRVKPDGEPPDSNPFVGQSGARPEIFTYGHRNPQGLAFHPKTGDLYSTEHGPVKYDEINILKKGQNYGWPIVTGDKHEENSEFTNPLKIYYPAHPSVAPASAGFYNGDLYFGSLGLEHVRRVTFGQNGREVMDDRILFKGRYGRIRTIIGEPSGSHLYFTTSNQAGGTDPYPKRSDDKIIRWTPE